MVKNARAKLGQKVRKIVVNLYSVLEQVVHVKYRLVGLLEVVVGNFPT